MWKKILILLGIIVSFFIILAGLATCAATQPDDPDSIPGVIAIREAKTQSRVRRASQREGRSVSPDELANQPGEKNVGKVINSTINGILPFPDSRSSAPKLLTPDEAIDQCYEILEHYRSASWLELKTTEWIFNGIAKRTEEQLKDPNHFAEYADLLSVREMEQMKKDIPRSQEILTAIKTEFKDVATDQEKDLFGGFINALSDINTALAKELKIEDFPSQSDDFPQPPDSAQ